MDDQQRVVLLASNELAGRRQDAERQAAASAQAAKVQAEQFKAAARAAFPGSAAEFDQAWPDLLRQWQMDQTRARTADPRRAKRAAGDYDL